MQVPERGCPITVRPAPTISVGLPVYNGERFVADAIESVLAQTFSDLELIIADNGSTDGTVEICRRFANQDDRIRLHLSPENRGAAWNYNRCVTLASGRYFKWAAHDDVLAPDFLRRCLEVLEERPDVVLAYPRAVDIDENGAEVLRHPSFAYAEQLLPAQRVRSALRNVTPCMESFGLVRREDLARTGLIGRFTGSDRVLFAELAFLGRFHEVPDALFRHRQHLGRSVHAYADDRRRNAWFDPQLAERFALPRLRLLLAYTRSVYSAPVAVRDRLGCAPALLQWAVRNRGPIARELVSAVPHLMNIRRVRVVQRTALG